MIITPAIQEALKAYIRNTPGASNYTIAAAIGVKAPSVSRWRTGKAKEIRPEHWDKLEPLIARHMPGGFSINAATGQMMALPTNLKELTDVNSEYNRRRATQAPPPTKTAPYTYTTRPMPQPDHLAALLNQQAQDGWEFMQSHDNTAIFRKPTP